MENNQESKLKDILVKEYKYPSSQVIIAPQLPLTPNSQKVCLDLAVYSCGVMIQAFEIKRNVHQLKSLTNETMHLRQTLGGEKIDVPIYGITFQGESVHVYNESGEEMDASKVLNYENAKSTITSVVENKLNTDLHKSIKYPIYSCATAVFLYVLVILIFVVNKCQMNCTELLSFPYLHHLVIFDTILWLLPTLLSLPTKYLKIKFCQFEFSMIK